MSFQIYYLKIGDVMRARLSQEDPNYLLNVDPEEYLEYLIQEATWQPLVLHEEAMTIEAVNAKQQVMSSVGSIGHDRPRVRLRIPTEPHPQRDEYLQLEPSTRRLNRGPAWNFEGDTLVIEADADEQAIERALDDVRFAINSRNADIEGGNTRLRQIIEPIWRERRGQVEAQHGSMHSLLQKLNIPLHRDPNAPAKPIELKRREIRTIIQRPQPKAQVELEVPREDVVDLVDFIEQYAKQFEITPEEYAGKDEEGLRNLLVGMMNANYPGSATGETFNKLGKTDIRLRVDEGNVLICECKIWHGQKAYGEALHQLFGYLTWRQNYGVLIHFCRTRDMTQSVDAAKQRVELDPTYSAGSLHASSPSKFRSRHVHPQDTGKLIEVHHLFFDLTVG